MSTSKVWIYKDDTRYNFLKEYIIKIYFPKLNIEDQTILLNGLVSVINMIYLKFGFSVKPDSEVKFWNQLKQQDNRDMRALINIILPFIDDDEIDSKKKSLENLRDLYTYQDATGKFYFTNSQYNRSIRIKDNNDKTKVIFRPYLKEYFEDHLKLIIYSIHAASNKLYVNWVDIIPFKMNKYKDSPIYTATVSKLIGPDLYQRKVPNRSDIMYDSHIDLLPGLTYQDIYNTVCNHLYYEIAQIKWLIFDIRIGESLVSFINYLENRINLGNIWNSQHWSQLSENDKIIFQREWQNILTSGTTFDDTFLIKFIYYFAKHHRNSQQLIKQKKLLLVREIDDDDDDDLMEFVRITPEMTSDAKSGLKNVPITEIYLYFYDQLSAFKKTWYYYFIHIKKGKYIASKDGITITPKNIYNYAKSMVHDVADNKLIPFPRNWSSLDKNTVNSVIIRMCDYETLNNIWTERNWFDISRYIRNYYPDFGDTIKVNYQIHLLIREKLVDIIFESLIYHGLLSDFNPNKNISDKNIIALSLKTSDQMKITSYQKNQIKSQYFTGENLQDYNNHAYYYLTGEPYGKLDNLKSKSYANYRKSYFDFLSSDQIWTFTYAMNWVSQVNFYHHYINNRVIYVTGSTGVGKSTQIPKLLMYSQKMIDFNSNGKIICTQPRIPPTITNAKTISKELGVPIEEYSESYDTEIPTGNYHIQYKYQGDSHMNAYQQSYLRIVTDGTLLGDISQYPFLTKQKDDSNAVDVRNQSMPFVKTYSSQNIYDIVIVDEAHEHNTNMDIILTLMRDTAYLNNSIKLVIISATMEDDEPIYRRYYRNINDNRAYPLSQYIVSNKLDRNNVDRRVHISPPGETTQYKIVDHYLSKIESEKIDEKNFVDCGIDKTVEVANSTTDGDILLFLSGKRDIIKATSEINERVGPSIIAMGYYSELPENVKNDIVEIDKTLPYYTRHKEDIYLHEADVKRRVPKGTYKRAIIIATNVAEASITLRNLKYVIDTGYAKMALYDPATDVTKMKTLPISQSSATQRKGRVGRLASGTVYHMYHKDKLINNKTAYQIANSDVKSSLLSLLKAYLNDSIIVNNDNNPNSLVNLYRILYSDVKTIFELYKNPIPIMDIIEKKYKYNGFNGTDTLNSVYYDYYGKGLLDIDLNKNSSKDFLEQYFINNHDDYSYQFLNENFISRAHSGYDSFILEDYTHDFYIISPDENIIERNKFTGEIIGLRNSPMVTDQYIYQILTNNDITFERNENGEPFFPKDINFDNFKISKFRDILENAVKQLLVEQFNPSLSDIFVSYKNLNSVDYEFVSGFFEETMNIYSMESLFAKSNLSLKLDELTSFVDLDILKYDTNNRLWFANALANNVDSDVLMLICMIDAAPSISDWISDRNTIDKFYNLHRNSRGDIYFIWKLWSDIKKVFQKNHLFDKKNEINADTKSKFDVNKRLYYKQLENTKLRGSEGPLLPLDTFILLDKMYKSGKLNSETDFYEYVNTDTVTIPTGLNIELMVKLTNIIATDRAIDPNLLIGIVEKYFGYLNNIEKSKWLNEYRVKNNLYERDNNIDWIIKTLKIPDIIPKDVMDPSWSKILETYIRTYGYNFLKRYPNKYIDLVHMTILEPSFITPKRDGELTLLAPISQYLVYHTSNQPGQEDNPSYLTSTKVEWVFELNPVFYYAILQDNIEILKDTNVEYNLLIKQVNSDLENIKPRFNNIYLIRYLDQLSDKTAASNIKNVISS